MILLLRKSGLFEGGRVLNQRVKDMRWWSLSNKCTTDGGVNFGAHVSVQIGEGEWDTALGGPSMSEDLSHHSKTYCGIWSNVNKHKS